MRYKKSALTRRVRASFAQEWGAGQGRRARQDETGDRPAGAGRLFAAPLAPKRRGAGVLKCGVRSNTSMARARRVRMCRDCGHITPKPTVSNTCRLCGGSLRVVPGVE